MPNRCVAPGCKVNYDSCKEKCSMFAAPKEEERRLLWQRANPRKDFVLKPSHYLCEKHFHEENIVRKITHKDQSDKIIAQSNFLFTQVLDASQKTAPYRLNLNYGFVPGQEVTITGIPSFGGERFSVDFVSQSFNNQDVAFHLNPRFGAGVVVRNSKFSGSWGHEEREGGLPLHQGQTFTLNFRSEHDGIRVYINGAFFTLFRHRQAADLISHIVVNGPVSITTLTYQANAPGSGPGSKPGYNIPLQNGFSTGCELTVVGTTHAFMNRFQVNLQSGPGPHATKLLHVAPRFREGVVVRNSCLGGVWGAEERGGGLPISAGSTFTLFVRCEHHGFNIHVNGSPLTFFAHRQSPHSIRHLEIMEGAIVNSVSYHSRLM